MKRTHSSADSPPRTTIDSAPVRALALVILLTAAALREAVQLTSLTNSDVWCHLRTGLWILQNHAAPRTGLFSQFLSLPWTDSTWGYDGIQAAMYQLFGLRSLPLLAMALQVGLAAALFLLARGSRQTFWPAVLLSASAQYALATSTAQPATCSIILFAVELALLLRSRRTGEFRPLLWLPLLFFFWANLHISFVYGIFASTLLLVVTAIESIRSRGGATWCAERALAVPVPKLVAITAGSLLASLCSPYSYHLYRAWFTNATSAAFRFVAELHANTFRRPQDYVLLLLAMGAFVAFGYQKSQGRSRDPFAYSLMLAAMSLSFAIQRDRWVAVLVSVAIIANASTSEPSRPAQEPGGSPWSRQGLAVAIVTFIVFVGAATQIPAAGALMEKTSDAFPAQAADYVRQNHLPQPLFNEYQWGSFLTWYLPEYPVAIDARADLYGDDLNLAYFELMNGYLSPESNTSFARAHTLLLKRNSGLAEAVRGMTQFTVVYSDKLAIVAVRKD